MESNRRLLAIVLSLALGLSTFCYCQEIQGKEIFNITNIEDSILCREMSYDEISQYYVQNQIEVRRRDGHAASYKLLNIICKGDNVLHVYEIDNGERTTIFVCFDPNDEPYPATLLLYDCMNGCSPTAWFEISEKTIIVNQLYEQMDLKSVYETTYEIDGGLKIVRSKITHSDTTFE